MFLEWDNPPPDAYTDAAYRTFLQDFNDRITMTGTGITRLDGIGQFDLVTGVAPTPKLGSVVNGEPLYYKFESVGNITVYMIFTFSVYQAFSAGVRNIMCLISLSDKVYNGIPSISDVSSISNGQSNRNVYYNTSHYYANTADLNFRYGVGRSFLLANPSDGTLVIQYNHSMKNTATTDLRKSVCNVILNAQARSFSSIGGYVSIANYSSMTSTDTTSYGETHSTRAAYVFDTLQFQYNMTQINILSMKPNINFIPLLFNTVSNELKSMKNIFYYDRNIITGNSIIDIGDDKLWLSGTSFENLSMTSSVSTQYGFAFKVN